MAGNGGDERKRGKEKRPIVSVVIPAYGCADTIGRAIESVLAQEIPLELIVINDCSPDKLDQVMDKYRSNPVLRYVHNSRNLGASGSRNKGVELAAGSYIAFLDADDWWAAGKLKRQVELLEKTGGVLCSTGRQLVRSDGSDLGNYIGVPEEITYQKLLHQNVINCSSVVLRIDTAREFPMKYEDSHEDYITWLNILKKHQIAYGINEPLLYYRLTGKGKSGSKLHSAKMTYKVYRYVGLGRVKSLYYFCWYAVYGVLKYLPLIRK